MSSHIICDHLVNIFHHLFCVQMEISNRFEPRRWDIVFRITTTHNNFWQCSIVSITSDVNVALAACYRVFAIAAAFVDAKVRSFFFRSPGGDGGGLITRARYSSRTIVSMCISSFIAATICVCVCVHEIALYHLRHRWLWRSAVWMLLCNCEIQRRIQHSHTYARTHNINQNPWCNQNQYECKTNFHAAP